MLPFAPKEAKTSSFHGPQVGIYTILASQVGIYTILASLVGISLLSWSPGGYKPPFMVPGWVYTALYAPRVGIYSLICSPGG